MTIYVVRHASAGSRHDWEGDDFARPLDRRGREQAEAVADFLAPRAVTRLLSSPAVRCTQTLWPLAAQADLEIDEAQELTEGATGESAATLARSMVDQTAVLCSHGDVIPALLRALTLDGLTTVGARSCEKGSVWALETRGAELVTGTYLGIPVRERLDR